MKPKPSLRAWLLIAAASHLVTSAAQGTILYWDGATTTADADGGAGTWTTTNAWDNAATGGANASWNSATPDSAVFGVLGGNVAANGVTAASITFNTFTGTYQIGTNFVGSTTIGTGGITMNAGAGVVTFIGHNTLGGNQSWINNSASLLTFQAGAQTSLLGTSGFALEIGGTGNTTIASSTSIVGSGSLTKTGAGTLVLASALNNYSGGTTITTGSVQSNQAAVSYGTTLYTGAFGTGLVTVDGTLDITGTNGAAVGGLSGNGIVGASNTGGTTTTLSIFGSGTNTFSGVIQNVVGAGNKTVGLTLFSSGTQILTNTNTYTGATTVNAGTLQIGNGATGAINSGSALVMGGGTLSLNNTTASVVQSFNGVTFNAGASSLTASAANATSGKINLGAITRTAPGATVDFATTGNVNTSTANTAAGIIGGYATFGGNTWAVANGAGNAITGLADGSYTDSLAGTTAPGSAVNVDFKASNITAWNDQSINSLRFSTAAASTLTLAANQTLTVTSGGILIGSAVAGNTSTITGGTIKGLSGKDLIVTQSSASHTLTIASAIADNTTATGFTASGVGGTIVLSGVNTYTGQTTLTNVTLQAGSSSALGTGSGALVANSATIDLNGNDVSVGAITGRGGFVQNSAVGTNKVLTIGNGNGAGNYTGVIRDNAGTGGTVALTKNGTGTILLGSANTFSGATIINSGGPTGFSTLNLGAGGTLANTSSITLNGGTLSLNSTDPSVAANKVNDSATIYSNGGSIRFGYVGSTGVTYAETFGTLDLASGNTNLINTSSLYGTAVQTATFTGFNRSGSYSTLAIGAGLSSTTGQRIRFADSGGTPLASGPFAANTAFVGPWAIAGNATSQSDYMRVDANGYVGTATLSAANLAAVSSSLWSASNNASDSTVARTLVANQSFNALKLASAAVVDVGAFQLATTGLIGNAAYTINGGTGSLTIPSDVSAGQTLYLYSPNGAGAVNVRIRDNGARALTLVVGGHNNGNSVTLSSSTSDYTGGTVISGMASGNAGLSAAGSVNLTGTTSGTTGPLGSTSNFLQVDSGTLNINANAISVGDFRGSIAGNINGSGTLTVGNGNNGGGNYAGSLSNTVKLIKTGTGTITLSGTNTTNAAGAYTISGGTLQFAKTSSLYNSTTASWTAANVKVNAGTLALNVGGVGEFTAANVTNLLGNLGALTATSGNGTSANGFAAGSAIAFDSTNAIGGSFTVADAIVNSTGSGGGAIGLTKLGTNTLVLSASSNTFTGGVTINAGTLQLGSTGALNSTAGSQNAVTFGAASTGTMALAGNSVVVANLSTHATPGTTFVQNANGSSVANAVLTVGNSTNQSGTYAGTIQNGTGGGTLALTKAGAGALTLSGISSYSGATTVSAGTLYVTGALSNSAVTVQANGTIGSSGGAGSRSLGNGLTIDAGGNLDLTGATLGLNSTDILGITGGALTLGNLTFQDLVGWDWVNAAPGTYELIDGGFTVNWGSTTFLSEGTAYDFGNGNKGYFTQGSLNAVIVAIPEPGAALLGGLGLLALLRRRRA